MKKITYLLILCSVIWNGNAQSKILDSLKASVNLENQDTVLLNNYWLIAREYMSIDLDSFAKYIDALEEVSLKNNNFKLTRIYDAKGLKFMYQNKLDSAEFYFKKALGLAKDNFNPIETSTIYTNYSTLLQKKRELNKAIEYLKKGIDLVKDNEAEVCLLYFNLASFYLDLELYSEAKKYLKLAYIKASMSGDKRVEGYALAGLGHLFNTNQQKDSAKYYLQKGIRICQEASNPQICHIVNLMLGELYLEEENYKLAKTYVLNTKRFAEIRNAPDDILRSYMYLGRVEGFLGNYKSSKKNYEKFEKLYDSIYFGNVGMSEFRYWADFEMERGNFKEATRLLKKYVSIKDSVVTVENRALLADADAKFDSEKKDKELAEQKLAIEKNELELQKKKTQYSYMTGALLVVGVGSVLLWFLYQQRQKRKDQEIIALKREQQVQTLESLMEGEEKERLRIAKELHDGVNVDLSAIKYKLTSLLEKNNQVINEAVTMIDKSCEQVRAISHNLIPPALNDFSLIETLEDFCTTANGIHDPEIVFNHIGEAIKISKKAEVNIFRIVQEIVNNSVKHAEASEITVQISHRSHTLQLTVEDNGIGFDRNKVKSKGIGLQNIQSRVDYLNAKLDFDSSDKGTSYIVDINTKELV